MNKSFAVMSLALFTLTAVPAYSADTILMRAKQRSDDLGQKAREKQQDLEQKARDAKAKLEENALNLVRQGEDALRDAKRALEQDLIDGKAALIEELSCAFKNVKTNVSTTGVVRVDGVNKAERGLVRLSDLYTGDSDRQHMAVAFSGSFQDGNAFKFQMVDLNDGQRVVRSGTLAQMGLNDLTVDCRETKRIISIAQGQVQVDTETAEKRLLGNTSGALRTSEKRLAGEAAQVAR